MFARPFAALGMTGLMLAAGAGSAVAATGPTTNEKVTICHATGSLKNPYVQITVSSNAVPAHLGANDGDFVSDPVTGCTVPPVFIDPDGPNGPADPFVNCVVSPGVVQTATTVIGTATDDTIDCTNASPGKTITGGDGNDTITGTALDDTIDAGNGNDTVTGGPGNDIIEGGNGNDTLTGSAGDDIVTDLGDGNDTITT